MKSTLVSALFWGSALGAFKLDLNDTTSIKDAAASVAEGLLSYYNGEDPGKILGILPGPPPNGDYYWGESAQMWNALIAYAHATGDRSFDSTIARGILWQRGPSNDFLTPNWTAALGNDDQGMWGMAAMTGAETGLANPSNDSASISWLNLTQNVFDTMANPERWEDDADSCGGGLRWQIPMTNNGHDYKNSISTGVLFNIAARLSHMTGNATFADWADKTWTWMESVGFLTANGSIYDGAHVENNCTDINKLEFSYNLGVFIEGAAHMYNSTDADSVWKARLDTLVGGVSRFTDDNCVPVEIACERSNTCTTDMLAFKSVLLRGLAVTSQLAPYTNDKLSCVLRASATATAGACDADEEDGAQCGFVWTTGENDGTRGAGQQMNALAALTSEYQLRVPAPASGNGNGTGSESGGSGSGTGGSGTGSSGSGSPTNTGGTPTKSTSGASMTADRAGSGIMVASVLLAVGFTALLA